MQQKMRSPTPVSTGFAPLARADAQLLILGTLPGQASLAAKQYYAQPRNAFWPILGDVLGFDESAPYATRVAALGDARIAVWDVCKEAVRKGSLDSALVASSIVPNDFAAFFADHREIRQVIFNGTKSCTLYRRHVMPHLQPAWAGLAQTGLPSTSSANTHLTHAERQLLWAAALKPARRRHPLQR
jgi:double-stranded uracil-DNA glycosylase